MWRVINRSQGVSHALTNECTIVGRGPDCDIVLPYPAVCRHHFQIHCRLGGCYLEDLRSRGGTSVGQDAGPKSGFLDAESEISCANWQVLGLTPLRVGDIFGHPACYLTLEEARPTPLHDWRLESNSQAMLLALRGTLVADSSRWQQFLAGCFAQANSSGDETIFRRLWDHPNGWLAAAGLARFLVAKASADIMSQFGHDELNRRKYDHDIWRACQDAESHMRRLLLDVLSAD